MLEVDLLEEMETETRTCSMETWTICGAASSSDEEDLPPLSSSDDEAEAEVVGRAGYWWWPPDSLVGLLPALERGV